MAPDVFFQLDEFETWLMYKPDDADSIWVPVAVSSWSWGGVAEKAGNGDWALTSSSKSATAFGETTDYPMWVKNVKDLLAFEYKAGS